MHRKRTQQGNHRGQRKRRTEVMPKVKGTPKYKYYLVDDFIISSPMPKMSDDDLASSPLPLQLLVLSMEVDDDDSFESYYRLRLGTQVKYVTISPGTFDRDTLSFPVPSLPRFPDNEEWTIAHLSRDETSS